MDLRFFSSFGVKVQAGVVQNDVLDPLILAQFQADLQISPPCILSQVHGTRLITIEHETDRAAFLDASPEGDALMTCELDTPLLIKTADCIPVVLADSQSPWIAAVHAGWRGLVAEIVPLTLRALSGKGARLSDLQVGVGPSLGPCCSVFSDPFHEIPERYHWAIREDSRVDLWAILERQFEEAGLGASQIEWMRRCSHCDSSCFSWRRGHDPRRMGTFIVRREAKRNLDLR